MEGMPTLSTGGVIAVTTVIHMGARGGGRLVYYCGVIGLCPPCTRAPSTAQCEAPRAAHPPQKRDPPS